MEPFFGIVLFFLILLILYLFLLQGRTGAPGLKQLQGWSYAHRGLHQKPRIPENSIPAFQAAVAKGYGAELDVHLLADGGLAVIHDSSLLRTTGKEGRVEDLTTEQLTQYTLEGTHYTIPTFSQVLEVFSGKTPLIIELKPIGDNVAALCEATCRVLESYSGVYCMESFDPRCLMWLKKHRPDIIRGQLSQNYIKDTTHISRILDWFLTNLLGNYLTRPDFIAYRFAERDNLSNRICLNFWDLQAASWTLTTREDYDTAVSEGALPIFEQFEP